MTSDKTSKQIGLCVIQRKKKFSSLSGSYLHWVMSVALRKFNDVFTLKSQ